MKKIDNLLNLIRFSFSEVLIIGLLLLLIGTSFVARNAILSYEPKNKVLENTLAEKKLENESYSYVEDILEEYYNYIEKYKSINEPDLFLFQEEIEALVPYGIQITESHIKQGEFTIRGKSPNLRTIDFLLTILNNFNQYYGGFIGDITPDNTTKEDTLFSFTIKAKIDEKMLKAKIYSGDIDGDGVIDSIIQEVTSASGVRQKKSVINDLCPFTPSFNIVIGKLIEGNKKILSTFPYYKDNYEKGYFTFDEETGCLQDGDTRIVFP